MMNPIEVFQKLSFCARNILTDFF